MLVDSGACETMLPAPLLEALGVRYSGEKLAVCSFSGQQSEAEVGAVRVSFGGGRFELTTRVLGYPGFCVPVLGMRDFFNRYFVAFDAGALAYFVEEPRRPSARH